MIRLPIAALLWKCLAKRYRDSVAHLMGDLLTAWYTINDLQAQLDTLNDLRPIEPAEHQPYVDRLRERNIQLVFHNSRLNTRLALLTVALEWRTGEPVSDVLGAYAEAHPQLQLQQKQELML